MKYLIEQGKTGLHRAAKAGFSVTMESLPSLAANVEMADLTGETLLFEPIRSTVNNYNKRIQALQLLLDASVDQQIRIIKGRLPWV